MNMCRYIRLVLAVGFGVVSATTYAQEHCRVRYQYNASGDRTQRDWHCWTPGDEENEPENWEYKRIGVLEATHMQVTPNPANERFMVVVPGKDANGSLQLINALGEVILTQSASGATSSIEVSDLPNGTYFIRYSIGQESIISACVVQH